MSPAWPVAIRASGALKCSSGRRAAMRISFIRHSAASSSWTELRPFGIACSPAHGVGAREARAVGPAPSAAALTGPASAPKASSSATANGVPARFLARLVSRVSGVARIVAEGPDRRVTNQFRPCLCASLRATILWTPFGGSSNGRTSGFGPENRGSNPCSSAGAARRGPISGQRTSRRLEGMASIQSVRAPTVLILAAGQGTRMRSSTRRCCTTCAGRRWCCGRSVRRSLQARHMSSKT